MPKDRKSAKTVKVPSEAIEVGRMMSFDPSKFQKFGNWEGLLPQAGSREHYIEGLVDLGKRQGDGQYRVVCLVKVEKSGKQAVKKKYFSATHYGTGGDKGARPDFVAFR